MKSINFYSIVCLVFLLISCSHKENEELNETVKITMREIGNQLLLANQDSTSLVLPIKELEPLRYTLSFEKSMSIYPDSLVSIVQTNLEKIGLPEQYRVEVIQCKDGAVAYSYQMKVNKDETIIPCSGRELPFNCYSIDIRFFTTPESRFPRKILLYIFGCITIAFVLYGIFYKKKSKAKAEQHYIKIGNYKFYKVQNKLIKEAEEISLSKKECELLAILVARLNMIVTREELTKRVWEDNGVIVGRSLDTFISKLRKKFKDDDTVVIENIHGVGYKLEVK